MAAEILYLKTENANVYKCENGAQPLVAWAFSNFVEKLNKEEIPEEFSKSQIATLNEKSNRQGFNIKKIPFAFTEQGIYMLATVLRGELAEQQSIFIMRTFREMRQMSL